MQTGDTVALTELGKEPIQMGDKTFNKTLWDLQKYEPIQDLPNAIEHDSEREQQKSAPVISTDKTKENEQDAPNQPKKTPNLSDFEFDLPSNIKNNYIAITKNRFLQDEKVNYYDKNDKEQVNIAFEDRSKSLHTSRQDDKTIHAMLDLAQSKGWSAIKLKGTEEFKQKAWLEASLRGIEVKGYTPNEKDLAELQAKQANRTTNQVEMTAQNPSPFKEKKQLEPSTHTPSSQQTIYNKLQEPKDNQAYLKKIGLDFSGVQVQRFAKDEKEAREQAVDFTGKELTNFQSGIQAIISKKNLEKMLSGKAEHKSVSKEIHALAVANADRLFENSVFAWQSNYKNDSPDIEAVHRAIAPMKVDNQVYLAKLTIKEMTKEQGNRVYSVEAVDIEQSKSPVPEMTEVDTAKYSVTPHRLNETLIDIIVQNAQAYNREHQKNVENFQSNDNHQKPSSTNELFNQQLQDLIDGKLNEKHIFQLGRPSDILLNTGFPNTPIELKASKLWEKSQTDWHKFDIASAKDLPKALQAPMAVFAYGDKNKSQNVITEIEHDGKKFVVGVHFNQVQDGIEVNSVRGFFPKDNPEWLNWIAQDKALYLDKEKVQTLIAQQRTNLADVSYLDLNLVDSIVKNFDNVKQNNKNPIPEMVANDQNFGAKTDRHNGALIDIIVQNAQAYNREYQKNVENLKEQQAISNPQKSAQEIKNDIRQIFQDGYKDGTIKSRDDLVALLKERGFEIKENEKSIRVSLPNSEQAVNLKGEVFTKDYEVIKDLKDRLDPDNLKQTYPTLKDSDIVHITAYKNKLFDDHKENPNIKVLQASLVQLESGIKEMANGKEMNFPALPVNEIKPDIEVRTTDNHDKSRTK